MISFPKAFFVTGTGTDVGKTVVSGVLLRGLKARYWKPIQCGYPTDTAFLKEITQLPDSQFVPEQFVFDQPVSPHLAARLSNQHIDLSSFVIPEDSGSHLIVEGAGGIFVPINEDDLVVDLIEYLNLPVLVVALSTLGTINHTLLTIKALRDRRLPVIGVVLNGPTNPSNRQAIEHYGKVSVLAECETLQELSPTTLDSAFKRSFDPAVEAVR